jgi:hypothetical protein
MATIFKHLPTDLQYIIIEYCKMKKEYDDVMSEFRLRFYKEIYVLDCDLSKCKNIIFFPSGMLIDTTV